MAYGKKKKNKRISGKSLIKKDSIITPPTPDVSEAPTPDVSEAPTPDVSEAPTSPATTTTTNRQQRRGRVFRKAFKRGGEPVSPTPPVPELIPIVKTLYDGANVRTFYGIKDTPIQEFLTEVIKDIPLFKIDELDERGNVLNTYQFGNKNKGGKGGKKKKKKKKKKWSIVKGDTKNAGKTKSPEEQQSLTQIVEENRYNISIDGVKDQAYPITYMGLENPDEVSAYMYDDPPIVEIPASLPESYQNSANEGVEELKDGRRCGNCIFIDPETSNCSKWNAEVRQYYWCESWDTMEPVIAQPNEFTQYIEESSSDNDLYNYFISKVKDPTTEEPNLSNFLSPLNALFATYGAYVYGDYLRRVVDSGNALDFDNVPINLFFTTQDDFLNAIDFINNDNLPQFNDPPEEYDSIQQALCTYTLTKKSTSTLPSNYPETITINLHGQFFGEPINILSQLDLVNAKIAYNPQYTAENHHVLKDNRFDLLETNGQLHIDIVKQSIRERVLRFLVDNSKPYMLNGTTAYRFTQWVADRSAFTETMQSLYQLLLNSMFISSENQELLDAIELSLSEQLFDDPSSTLVPLETDLGPGTEDNEEGS